MLEALARIIEDRSGRELQRLLLRAFLYFVAVALVAALAFLFVAAGMDPIGGLDGTPFVLLNGAYALYWAPVFAAFAAILAIAFWHGVTLTDSNLHVFSIIGFIFLFWIQEDMVQKTTNFAVERQSETGEHSYYPCARLRDSLGPGPDYKRNAEGDRVYDSHFDYVFTTSPDLCVELKTHFGRPRLGQKNLYHDNAWGNSVEFRRSVDPEQTHFNRPH